MKNKIYLSFFALVMSFNFHQAFADSLISNNDVSGLWSSNGRGDDDFQFKIIQTGSSIKAIVVKEPSKNASGGRVLFEGTIKDAKLLLVGEFYGTDLASFCGANYKSIADYDLTLSSNGERIDGTWTGPSKYASPCPGLRISQGSVGFKKIALSTQSQIVAKLPSYPKKNSDTKLAGRCAIPVVTQDPVSTWSEWYSHYIPEEIKAAVQNIPEELKSAAEDKIKDKVKEKAGIDEGIKLFKERIGLADLPKSAIPSEMDLIDFYNKLKAFDSRFIKKPADWTQFMTYLLDPYMASNTFPPITTKSIRDQFSKQSVYTLPEGVEWSNFCIDSRPKIGDSRGVNTVLALTVYGVEQDECENHSKDVLGIFFSGMLVNGKENGSCLKDVSLKDQSFFNIARNSVFGFFRENTPKIDGLDLSSRNVGRNAITYWCNKYECIHGYDNPMR